MNGEIWTTFNSFRQDYERRHAALESRMTAMESRFLALASREDVARMESAVSHLEALLTQFEEKTTAMATKTDVDWLKRFLWFGFGALSSGMVGIAVAFTLHLANFK